MEIISTDYFVCTIAVHLCGNKMCKVYQVNIRMYQESRPIFDISNNWRKNKALLTLVILIRARVWGYGEANIKVVAVQSVIISSLMTSLCKFHYVHIKNTTDKSITITPFCLWEQVNFLVTMTTASGINSLVDGRLLVDHSVHYTVIFLK